VVVLREELVQRLAEENLAAAAFRYQDVEEIISSWKPKKVNER
jgi:sRNA-binding carbon storage regulator CsrA